LHDTPQLLLLLLLLLLLQITNCFITMQRRRSTGT